MKKQQQFCVSSSYFPSRNTNNPNKTKESEYQQAGRKGFIGPLSIEHPCRFKKTKTSSAISPICVASRTPGTVSTELKIFDDTWVFRDSIDPDSRKEKSGEELERKVAFNLRMMRSSYTLGDLLEERSRGVSTELSLYHHDPFMIKKKMKPSDLGNLCRLLVSADLVEKHILSFLNDDQIEKVVGTNQENNGLRVWVWDIDTRSMHQLVFKRWSSSKSYIFNDGWTGHFVRRRNLREGDEIGLYWDNDQSRFHFSVLSRAGLLLLANY